MKDDMKNENQVRKLMKEYDFKVESIRRNKHWIVKASRDGVTKTFTMPVSGSDWRGTKNLTARLRKL